MTARFNVVCDNQGNGCPPGKYAVLVEWRDRTGDGVVPVKTRGKTKLVKRSRVRSGPDRLGGRYFDISQASAPCRGLAPVQYSASVRARWLSHRHRGHECPISFDDVTLIKSFYLGDANMAYCPDKHNEKDRLHTD